MTERYSDPAWPPGTVKLQEVISSDKAQKDAEELREQLAHKGRRAQSPIGAAAHADNVAETAHQQLETQLQALQSSAGSSSAQV